jgi:16S rRNA (cytosine967-C5)-methyltransferase
VVGPEALVLDKALAVEAIPGFEQGEWSVQDAGAQLAAHLLDVQDGQRVLDACAAPGGKTCHLLERADIDLLSLDVDAQRCQRIESNIDRLGLPMPGSRGAVRVLAGDAATPATWWDGIAFDRILLDAPCTASGIVRRHPDIRWLRRRGDIATLSQQQSRLLTALWPLLKPGGKLLFSTCSVFPGEGAEVIDRFVQQTSTAQRESINWTWPDGRREAISQLLPCTSPDREHDGFFYALLSKGQ